MTDTQLTVNAPMSVFLTGATTALGREVIRQLVAAGHRVTGVVTTSAAAKDVRAAGGLPAYPGLYRAGELRSAIVAAEAKVVLNLEPQAANQLPQHPAPWDERIDDAARALVDASAQAGVEFLVHTSYAFADARNSDAAALLKAIRAAEKAVLQGPVPACVLRLGFNYGADSDALVAVREKLRMGRSIPTGTDTPARWVYAPDAARAVIAAALARPTHEVFNIVDDHPVTPSDFLHTFADEMGMGVSGGNSLLTRAQLSRTQWAIMGLESHASSEQAREKLGWSPRFPSIREGIEDTLLSWRAQEPIVG